VKARPGTPILLLLIVLFSFPSMSEAQGRTGGTAAYSVATLAPWDVTVPPIVLENDHLHALLVELAGGASPAQLRRELGIDSDELEQLFRLIESEGLGRQTAGGGWVPLSLALTEDEVARLRTFTDQLSPIIADSVEARWSVIDSLISRLPVTGRLPLEQTGFVLLGDYLLGLFQYEALWAAGLGPTHRRYAFRVYRMDPALAPPGHRVIALGSSGWQLVDFSSEASNYGFPALLDPESPLRIALLGDLPQQVAERTVHDLVNAYRLWYLMDVPPDGVTRQFLGRLEAVDAEGRLRVPIISADDIAPMRSIALDIGEGLWPHLVNSLPGIAGIAAEIGYDDPGMLGEVTLAVWEMAAHEAVHLLVERGMVLPPPSFRGQALLVRSNR
jgi:hypothetical protein